MRDFPVASPNEKTLFYRLGEQPATWRQADDPGNTAEGCFDLAGIYLT